MKEFTKIQRWRIESLIEKYTNNNNGDFEITISNNISYVDDDGKGYAGLDTTKKFFINKKDVYVFDNHNKAIFSVFEQNNKWKKKFDIVHIDAHKDNAIFKYKYPTSINKQNIKNFFLKTRISDYIDLMQKTNMIKDVTRVTQSWEFEKYKKNNLYNDFLLNLDIDIFGDDGKMVELELKIQIIIEIWKKAKAVMVATSPGFINQKNAKFLIESFLKKI